MYDPADRISAQEALKHPFFHVQLDENGREITHWTWAPFSFDFNESYQQKYSFFFLSFFVEKPSFGFFPRFYAHFYAIKVYSMPLSTSVPTYLLYDRWNSLLFRHKRQACQSNVIYQVKRVSLLINIKRVDLPLKLYHYTSVCFGQLPGTDRHFEEVGERFSGIQRERFIELSSTNMNFKTHMNVYQNRNLGSVLQAATSL